ncbi:hypothetical protein THAOC_27011, partial [Thalassiosira oceanica]
PGVRLKGAKTAWLLDQIHDHLGAIRDKTTEIFNPSHVAQLQQPRQKAVNRSKLTKEALQQVDSNSRLSH